MKKLLNIFLITIIFVIPFITNINIIDAKILKYGDVNEDNFIDGEDVSLVHAFINNAEVPIPIQKALADINHDGNIDNTDKDLVYQMTMNTSEKLYQKGDVNMNGIIDPIDTYLILYGGVSKIIEFSSLQKELADTDNNGTINALDRNSILKYINENLLMKKIINNVSTGPNFADDSTDNGLFLQIGDKNKTKGGFPVYYYRGNVENNYVQFGTYKTDITNNVYNTETDSFETNVVAHTNDPIIWRIISIDSKGNTKLISEYALDGIKKYENTSAKYINDDGSNSEFKTDIENWYNTHISVDKEADSKVQKSNYCNDITGIDFNRTDTIGSFQDRRLNYSPTFICPEEAITDNNKVGLITADEVMYAGGEKNYSKPYLHTGVPFFTMTSNDERTWYAVSVTGGLGGTPASSSTMFKISLRPVITLKPNVLTTVGDGTKDNPYVIK